VAILEKLRRMKRSVASGWRYECSRSIGVDAKPNKGFSNDSVLIGKRRSRNKWRMLPACGATVHRKLEARGPRNCSMPQESMSAKTQEVNRAKQIA
jgi:hypothetical protein